MWSNIFSRLSFFIILLLVHFVKAEETFTDVHGDFFRVLSYERTDVRAGYLYEFDAKESDGPGQFDLHNIFGEFNLRSSYSRDSFFSFGGEFESRRYLFNLVDGANTRAGSEQLYGISLNPGFGTFLTDDILFWGKAIIGSYSDLEGGITDTDDYQVLGKAEFAFRINPGAQIILGASYSNDYLDQKLLPYLGIRLVSDTGRFNLSIDLPFHGRIGYYITPKIETFGQLIASGDRYQASINNFDLEVGVHDERLGGGLRFWLFDKISLTFEGGRTVSSKLEFDDIQAGQFTSGDIDSHWYLRSYFGFAL